jgi:cell division septation protein DedD
MREKSQLEDMRAAIRGDMERARARREADPWRTPDSERQPAPGPAQESEPAQEAAPEPEPEPAAEAAVNEIEPPPSAQPAAEPPAPAKRGFFGRLFGRG